MLVWWPQNLIVQRRCPAISSCVHSIPRVLAWAVRKSRAGRSTVISPCADRLLLIPCMLSSQTTTRYKAVSVILRWTGCIFRPISFSTFNCTLLAARAGGDLCVNLCGLAGLQIRRVQGFRLDPCESTMCVTFFAGLRVSEPHIFRHPAPAACIRRICRHALRADVALWDPRISSAVWSKNFRPTLRRL